MLDIEQAAGGAHPGDPIEVALQQGQQVALHLLGHVGAEGIQAPAEVGRIGGVEGGEVEGLPGQAVQQQGVLVGFETADDGIDGAVAGAENVLGLPLDGFAVLQGGCGVVGKTGAAPLGVTP